MSYENMTDEDKRMIIEGRVLNIFTDKKYGRQRIVDTPIMQQMQKELIDEFYKMREEGLL